MRGKNMRRPKSPRRILPVHPVDERGLPLIPESINLECDPAKCRLSRPYKDRQHVMHPANEYRTPLEREFRNLGCFVITMCRCQHENWDRGIDPPKHVSNELMKQVIKEYKQGDYEMRQEGQLFDTEPYIPSLEEQLSTLDTRLWDSLEIVAAIQTQRAEILNQLKELAR